MSHIPARAMPHAAAAPPPASETMPAPDATAPPTARDWLTLGGIAALAGVGVALMGRSGRR